MFVIIIIIYILVLFSLADKGTSSYVPTKISNNINRKQQLSRRNNNNNKMAFCQKQQKELTPQEQVTLEWDGMAGEWDDLASGYAKHFYKILWEITGLDRSKKFDVVIDFGCGTGLLTDLLRPHCNKILSIDVSTKMIQQVKEKIRSNEWTNVQAITAVLANMNNDDNESEEYKIIQEYIGCADLIVASSVLTFIPENDDINNTMKMIGKLLKPNAIFVHSDWPKSEAKHPDAMTEEKAISIYTKGNLIPEFMKIIKMDMGGGDNANIDVFFGIAKK